MPGVVPYRGRGILFLCSLHVDNSDGKSTALSVGKGELGARKAHKMLLGERAGRLTREGGIHHRPFCARRLPNLCGAKGFLGVNLLAGNSDFEVQWSLLADASFLIWKRGRVGADVDDEGRGQAPKNMA